MATGDKKILINQRVPAVPACPRLKNGRAKESPQKSPKKRPGQRSNRRPFPTGWRCWPQITTAQPAPGSRRHWQPHQVRRAASCALSCAPAGAGEHGPHTSPPVDQRQPAPPWPPSRSTSPTLGAQHLAQPWGHKPKSDGGTKPTRRGTKRAVTTRAPTKAQGGGIESLELHSARPTAKANFCARKFRGEGGVSQPP